MVIGSAKFSYFIEAPNVAGARPTPAMSGSNIANVRHLLQGVEATTDESAGLGVLPIVGTGVPSSIVEADAFGQSRDFLFETMFDDVLTNATRAAGDDAYAVDAADGGIEPLSEGMRLGMLAINETYGIVASMQIGNETELDTTEFIVQSIDMLEQQQTLGSFIDTSDIMGTMSGSVRVQSTLLSDQTTRPKFDDAAYVTKTFVSGSITGRHSDPLVAALIAMDATSDSMFERGQLSSGAGFVYGGSTSKTDSLAFGGLKK